MSLFGLFSNADDGGASDLLDMVPYGNPLSFLISSLTKSSNAGEGSDKPNSKGINFKTASPAARTWDLERNKYEAQQQRAAYDKELSDWSARTKAAIAQQEQQRLEAYNRSIQRSPTEAPRTTYNAPMRDVVPTPTTYRQAAPTSSQAPRSAYMNPYGASSKTDPSWDGAFKIADQVRTGDYSYR